MKKLLVVVLLAVLLSLTACKTNGVFSTTATPEIAATEAPTEVETEVVATAVCDATEPPAETEVVATETVTPTETPASVASSIAMVEFPNCAKNAVEIVTEPEMKSMNQYFFLDDRGFGRVANDVDLSGSSNVSTAFRWWQAVMAGKDGSKNIPWTHLISDMKSSTTDLGFALIEPTKYQVTVPADGATFELTILRDMNAAKQMAERGDTSEDPYDVAIKGDWSQKSDKQLSWYISGNGFLKTTEGWIELSKYSAVEIAFPRELKQGLVITIVQNEGGTVFLWQGAAENCYVATDQLHKDVPLIDVPTKDIWQ